MAKYQPDPNVMTPGQMVIALEQHRNQHPVVAVQNAAQTALDALQAAYSTQDGDAYRAAMETAWNSVVALQAIGEKQHEGFQNAYALSKSLTEQLTTLLQQLSDEAIDPAQWDIAVAQFAARIEQETFDNAEELMIENMASAMTGVIDISEADAKVFISVMHGNAEPSAARVLGQMIPQLEALLQRTAAK